MASTVKDTILWLSQFSADTMVGVDEDGLTLMVDVTEDDTFEHQPYFEIGGLPESFEKLPIA